MGKRHTEGARDRPIRLRRVDGDQAEFPVPVEPPIAVVQRGHRVVTHKFRHRRLDLGAEHLVQQVGAASERVPKRLSWLYTG